MRIDDLDNLQALSLEEMEGLVGGSSLNNSINGSTGADTLVGGSGADSFYL